MITTSDQPNSEAALMASVFKLSDAGASVIQIQTRESIRAAMVLRQNLVGASKCEYREWDVVNGFRTFTQENYTNNINKGDQKLIDFHDCLMHPLSELRTPSSSICAKKDTVHYFIYVDAHPYIKDNPLIIELLQQYAAILPTTNVCLIFITPEVSLEGVPPGTVMVTEMKTPSADELEAVLRKIINQSEEDFEMALDDGDYKQIAQLGLGLTLFEFETYAAIAIVDAGIKKARAIDADMMSAGIALGKTDVVKQSEILELYANVDMSEVGGMQRLKDWVATRQACYSDEAREFGIEPPKGAVVVGVPGTGKSLVAKAISSELGIPLVRFSVERVFSKYVGDSESRVRSALAMVEAMAPCVLFIDEIDKGLSGTANGGDGGVSSRVLGTLLTWLNDCKAPVFTMVTANRVEGLPPELLRKGRFDQIFSVGLPTSEERKEVLDIHMRKRGHEIDFDKKDIARFVEYSERYVPAEIEAAVKDALILAFNEGEGATLQMEHIVQALQNMVPMSVSNAAQIDAIIAWASTNAVPVNYPVKPISAAIENAAPARRTRIDRTK